MVSTSVPEWLTVEEVADLLRVTPSALYIQRHRGQLPGALGAKVGRRILWRRTDLDSWFDELVTANVAEVG